MNSEIMKPEITKPGIYALVSLTGAPLHPADLAALHLAEGPEPFRTAASACAARVHDAQPAAISIAHDGPTTCVFAGYLDEPQDLAATLGLAPETSPALLAAAAVHRFGKQAPAELLGEWSLLLWNPLARELTLVASQTLRDAMFFALFDGCLAVAPDILTLGSLTGVGLALDWHGYALSSSRAGLRHLRTEETLWQGIRMIVPGATERFRTGSRQSSRAAWPTHFEPFPGTFEEAAEALQAVGRRVIRQLLERHGKVAFQLSGGLDSTLLTSWGAYEQGPGREIFCVSSVAPPGSRLPDESRFIRGAAAALGVPVTECWPRREADLFRAEPGVFEDFAAPIAGAYPTQEAMDDAALAGGATAVLCGVRGEMHLSAGFDIPETRGWLRRQVSSALDWQARRLRGGGWPANAFGPQFNKEFLAGLPRQWAKVWRKGPVWGPRPTQTGVLGISPMWYKNADGGTAGAHGIRLYMPFRDARLMRLAATMPVAFLAHEGITRPFARHLLRGRVPQAVWAREQGRGFAPDYASRLKRQAAEARERIPAYTAAGIGRWIDLDWLAQELLRLENSSSERDTGLFFSVQTTAIHAEFLLWALSHGIKL